MRVSLRSYDDSLLDPPCVTNIWGPITAWNNGTNSACIHMIGEFGKGSGDPRYRLSAQLPRQYTANGIVNSNSSSYFPNWCVAPRSLSRDACHRGLNARLHSRRFPNGTTTTDSAFGNNPQGRHLLSRELLGHTAGGGNQP